MLRSALHLLLTLMVVPFLASSASAAPVFEDDFSTFVLDWWRDIDWTQNLGSVTLDGGGVGVESATSKGFIPIDDFDSSIITLTVLEAGIESDLRLAVTYYDNLFESSGWGYIDLVTGAGDFGGMLSDASLLPPAGTDWYKVRLEMTTGTATVDHVVVDVVPEPSTAALLGLGLLALAVARRAGAFA